MSDFDDLRPLLLSVAYRMLGSTADAEDMVQDAFVRWHAVDRESIRSPRAFLLSVVTRRCIDHLRSARVRREAAMGLELPDPVSPDYLAAAEEVELADSLSIAFLQMLQKLSPVERAVFLLREVFEYDHREVAQAIGKNEANCRQILSRARRRLGAGEERFEASDAEAREVVERFESVLAGADMQGLVELLAPTVTLYADGGSERPAYGRARAVRTPVVGADTVARLLLAVQSQAPPGVENRLEVVNGRAAVLAYLGSRLMAVLSFEIRGGRIHGIFIQQDPVKLSGPGLGALRHLAG